MKRISIFALALLLAAIAWFVLDGEESEPTPSLANASSLASDPDEHSSIQSGTKENPDDVTREVLDTSQALAPEPSGSDETVLLTFVQSETQEPLPHLDFFHFRRTAGDSPDWKNIDEHIREYGDPHRTDANGQIAIPTTASLSYVSVWEDGLFARHYLRSSGGKEQTVEVSIEEQLRVEVIDAEGAPAADIQVSFLEYLAPKNARSLVTARTDAQGVAILKHLQFHDPVGRSSNPRGVILGVASLAPPGKKFPRTKTPSAVRLQLPPTAIVHLSAFQADGTLFPDGTNLSLQAIAPNDLGNLLFGQDDFSKDLLLGSDRLPMQNGRASFHAELRLHLEFALHLPSHRRMITAHSEGPTAAGQEVELEIRLQEEPCWVVGRLVDTHGVALAKSNCQGRLATQGGSGPIEFITDEHGVFRIPIDDRLLRQKFDEPGDSVFRSISIQCVRDKGHALIGHFPLNRNLEPGENHIGDVNIGAELLLKGRVIDTEGLPVAYATLRPRWSQDADPSFQEPHVFAPLGTNRAFRVDAQGQFEVWTSQASTLMQTHIQAHGFLPRDMILEPGQAFTEIVLQRKNENRIRVLLPEGTPQNHLEFTFHDVGGSTQKPFRRMTPKQGSLELGRLAAGVYRLSVCLRGDQVPILEMGNILVGPDTAVDPRLDPLDLRQAFLLMELNVIGPHGLAAQTFQYRFLDAEGKEYTAPNRGLLPVRSGREPLNLWTEESLVASVSCNAGYQEVRLQPATKLILHLSSIPELGPKEGLLVLVSGPGRLDEDQAYIPGEDLTFITRESGTIDITILSLANHENEAEFDWLETNGASQFQIEVAPGALEVRADLKVTRRE